MIRTKGDHLWEPKVSYSIWTENQHVPTTKWFLSFLQNFTTSMKLRKKKYIITEGIGDARKLKEE